MALEGTRDRSRAIWHVTRDGTPARPGPEGFVHASFTPQLEGTLALHFPGVERLVLLRLDPERLGTDLVLEPSREGALFPHVYRDLRAEDVRGRREIARGPDGRFDLSGLPA